MDRVLTPNRGRVVAALLSTQLLAGAFAASEVAPNVAPAAPSPVPAQAQPAVPDQAQPAAAGKAVPAQKQQPATGAEGSSAKKPAAKKPAAKKPAANGKTPEKPVKAPARAKPGTATSPASVSAPLGTPASAAPPLSSPPGTIRLDFHGANIDAVLQAYAMAFRWTVVKDPACTGEATIMETRPLDQKRALRALQALLDVRGFTAVLDEDILKIMTVKRAVGSATHVRLLESPTGEAESQEIIRAVIPLSNAEASALSKDLQPLLSDGASIIGAAGANALIITDTASNISALRLIISALDKGAGNNEWKIFHLTHVSAKKMVDIITDLFKQIAPRTPPPPMGQPGQPQPFPQPGQVAPKSDSKAAVAAVEDERSNSIIVVGSADNLKRVGELVTQLDEGLNPHTVTKVYEVKYAEALKLAQMVNDGLLGGTGSGGSQKPMAENFNPFGGGNPFERRAQGTPNNSFSIGDTHIVADSRTNKLVITADDDTMKVVEQLLSELDKPVEYATTTFSLRLKNANAEDMAYVLSQALGTSAPTSFNPFGNFGGNNGAQGSKTRQDRRIHRRETGDSNQQSSSFGGGTQLASLPQTGFIPDDRLPGRLADASRGLQFPPGAEELAQFIYDPGYGQRSRGSEATTGRTSTGKYVNLLQLQGNVMVTAERNTNSLILTTTPENELAVRQLVNDLDVEVKQVLLEAIVAEVSLDRYTKFGVNYLFQDLKNKVEGVFPALPNTGPLGTDPLTNGLRYTVIHGDFSAILTAISEDDRVNIMSTPSVFTSNNQEAEIEVTDSIPYLKGTTIGFGGQTSTDVDFKDVGLILNVTPRITDDGMVAVDVYQEDSSLLQLVNVGNGAQAPETTQRVTDTSVTLKDGDTLILGGLQKDTITRNTGKVPILGDIPLLGNLFRSHYKEHQRDELVVFLTPRVISRAAEARRISRDRMQKTLKSKMDQPTEEGPEKTESK